MKEIVVVNVHAGPMGNGLSMDLDEPTNIPDGFQVWPLDFDPAADVPTRFRAGAATTDEMGTYLMDRLRVHPGVQQAFQALLTAGPGQARPLYIRLTKEAEALPWETLFSPGGGFLALDPRWPIARIVREGGSPARVRDFEPPLRVMLVLSAAGVDAAEEWRGLWAALQASPMPVAIRVLVAQDDLLAEIQAAAHPNVSVDAGLVPPGMDLLASITAFRPSILHFFCHGEVTHGFPQLRIATRSSWGDPVGTDDVVIEPQSLATEAILEPLWLLALNACRGADSSSGSGSLVYSLVAHGFPAVAGMREPVSETDANAFSRGFYRALMALLGPVAAADEAVDLDLAAALHAPRLEICDLHRGADPCALAATTSREWTLPVLYVRSGSFPVRRRVAAGAAVADPEVLMVVAPEALVPAVSADERITLLTKLSLLRDVLDKGFLDTQPAKLELLKAEIAATEAQLFAA